MAINKEDTLDSSFKARLSRSIDASYASAFLTEMFSLTSRYKRSEDHLLQTLGGAAAILSIPMYMLLNLENSQFIPPEIDEGAIYTAISEDEGRTGYVIFQQGADYSLYEFENRRFAGGYSLQLVTEQDEAWFIARSIADDFSNIVDAYNDVDVPLSARPWDIYSIGDITSPAVNSHEEIIRIATEFSEVEPTQGVSLIEHFSSLESEWMQAAQSIGAGNLYFTDSNASYPAFETQTVNPASESILDETLALLLISTSLFAFATSSVSPARRRHADKKRKLDL